MKPWFKRFTLVILLLGLTTSVMAQEVIVLAGLDETIAWLQGQNWWGEEKRGEQLTVPRTMIAGVSKQWRKNAPTLPVSTKKEIFYRFMLPLVVHANAMVVDRRERLQRLADTIKAGGKLTIDDDTWLREIAVILIASFQWPFDSVRGYFINLSSHPAYEDFRRLRAKRKAAGKPLRSLDLAEGLKNYSERGQKYVDTLKRVTRVNKLDIADDAVFRDEAMRFVLGAADSAAAEKLRAHIDAMRKSGEIEKIIARMRLE